MLFNCTDLQTNHYSISPPKWLPIMIYYKNISVRSSDFPINQGICSSSSVSRLYSRDFISNYVPEPQILVFKSSGRPNGPKSNGRGGPSTTGRPVAFVFIYRLAFVDEPVLLPDERPCRMVFPSYISYGSKPIIS